MGNIGIARPKAVVLSLFVLALPIAALAQTEEPAAEAAADEGAKERNHQISAGIGLPICIHEIEDGDGSTGCIGGDFFWMNFPVMYRYRFNEYIALGGGVMINKLGDEFPVGGGLRGGIKFYAIGDWLYIQADIFAGIPHFLLLIPGIGHAFRITDKLAMFVENEAVFWFIGDFFVYWQPVIGAELRF